jgi:hypothetical protein
MSKGSGIGIGGLIFWAFIIFQLFSDDDEEEKKNVEVSTQKNVIEEVKEKAVEIIIETKDILVETDDGFKPIDDVLNKEEPEVKPEPEVKDEPKKEERFKPI